MKAEMFWVKHKETGQIYLVYEIRIFDDKGVTFLMYIDGKWQYEVAQLFEPYDSGYKGTKRKKILNEGDN